VELLQTSNACALTAPSISCRLCGRRFTRVGLSQYRLPSESALITLSSRWACSDNLLPCVAVGVLPTLRRLARVGYIRSSLAFLLFVVLSSCHRQHSGGLSLHSKRLPFEDSRVSGLESRSAKMTGTMTCGDFPLIDVGHRGADHWSKSQSDHNAGLLANR